MSDNGSDIGAFMAGFVIGGLVGAATALILAPQSGADTRAQIASRGDELWHSGEQQFVEYREKAQGRVQDTSDQIQERARIVLEEGKQRVFDATTKKQPAEGETTLASDGETGDVAD